MTDDLVDYDPQDYPEAVAWGQERAKELRRQRERIAKLEADRKDLMKRLWTSEEKAAGLEAELANAKEEATTERLSAEEWYLKAQGLEAELAALKGENAGYKDGAQRLIESNTRLLKRAEEAEAKVEHLHEVLEQAEAELAALKARRCDGCKHWQLHRPDTFDCDIEACGEAWLDRSGSFSCSEWQART